VDFTRSPFGDALEWFQRRVARHFVAVPIVIEQATPQLLSQITYTAVSVSPRFEKVDATSQVPRLTSSTVQSTR
jgi:hypothetical protein